VAPEAIHAICEEYRAAATLDVTHDNEDRRAGRRIRCPLLALWSADSALDQWYRESDGPLGIWRAWAPEATGRAIVGGHFFPEQNPGETIAELRSCFAR
jgi:haloacetate dehalogenase